MIQRALFGSFLSAAAFCALHGGRLVRVNSNAYFVVWGN